MAQTVSPQQGMRPRRKRSPRNNVRVDMTPMVDLAFLLLTFFILTTTLGKQNTIEINMPFGGESDPVDNALTVIVSGNDRMYCYENALKANTQLSGQNLDGVRELILRKNKTAVEKVRAYDATHAGIDDSTRREQLRNIIRGSERVYVIIKYDSLARYRNIVDLIDEMEACSVGGQYAVVKKLEPLEKQLLARSRQGM